MCSQAFLGVLFLLSQQHSQPQGILDWSEAWIASCELCLCPRAAGAGWSLSWGLGSQCVWVWGGRDSPGEKQTKLHKKVLAGTSLHRQGFVDCGMWWLLDFFFAENIFLGASSSCGSICEFTLDHRSGHEGKKKWWATFIVCPPSSFSQHFSAASYYHCL